MKNSSHACKPWRKKQEGWGPTEIWTRVAGFTSSKTQGQSVGSAKIFKHGRNSPWARSIQPKFQPVLVHFKRWTRFFETFPVRPNRSNEFPLSSDFKQTISKRSSECWLLTGQKMLCVIVPSRQLASPEFFSCVPTRRLLSRILVRFVHRGCACNSQGKLSLSNFLNRNEGAIDDSWKHFGCYQWDHSNLHRENSVSDRSQGTVNNIYEGHDRRKFEYIV